MGEQSESLTQLQEIANLAPCGIGLYDLETSETVFLNDVYYQLIGYTKEEYSHIQNDFNTLMFPTDTKVSQKSKQDFEQVGAANGYEYRIVRKDGEIRWIKLNISTVNLGNKKYAFASFTDITTEKELSSHLSLIAQNVGSSLSLIKVSDRKEQLIYANDVFYQNIGIAPEIYLKNMTLYDQAFVSPEDHLRIKNAAQKALQTGAPGDLTYKFVKPDGQIMWHNRRFAAIKQDSPDAYLLVSVVTDVTEKKESELAAALEQQRFQTVIKELNAAVFEWNLKENKFYCSEAYQNYALSQISNDDILNNRGSLDTVHPDDVEILKQFFIDTNSGKDKVETVMRLRLVDGTYRWCRLLGFYYKDKDGNPSHTVGVIIDINEERERSFMMSNLLNEMPGGVTIFTIGREMRCQYFSDGIAKLTGYSKEEAAEMIASGTLVKKIVAPVDYEHVVRASMIAVAKGNPINITYRFISKDGNVGWLHLSATKMRDDGDEPVYYCVFTSPTDETALYRSIVEDSAIGVFVADRMNRNILYINEAANQICGLSYNVDVVGHSIIDFLAKINKKPLLTDAEVTSLVIGQYSEFHVERNHLFLAVKAKALMWNGVDSYILYITDETKEHERQVQLQELVNKVPTGIGIYDIIDGQARSTYLNDAYYEMLGVTRESRKQYYGDTAMLAVYPEDRKRIKEAIERVVKGADKASALHRICNGEGKWIWLNLTASVVERKKNHVRIYAAFSDCDEMVRTQQKMELNQKKEQVLMASIPGGVAIYRLKKSGIVTTDYVSKGLAKLCGYDNEYEEFFEYLKDNAMVNVVASEIPMVMEAAQKSLEDKAPISVTYHIHTKNGADILNRLDANLITESELGEDDIAVWYAVHTKVSEDSQLAIKEQHRYRAIMDALNMAFLEWEKNIGFYASEKYAAYALSDYPYNVVMKNQADASVVHPDDIPVLTTFFGGIGERRKSTAATLRMKMKDGSYRWTEMVAFNDFDKKGNITRVIGILRDIDKERIEQNKRLQMALTEAEKANQAKTAFLSRVSHDMRTPLNGILGLNALLKEYVTDNQINKDLAEMEMSGQYLLNLINDTLDVSRIESGKLELHPIVCDGKSFFENAIGLAKSSMKDKHITFNVKADKIPFSMLYIDAGRIQQIVMNVIGNAIKFTPEGGKIDVAMTNLSHDNGYLVDQLVIQDSGIGMSPEFLPHIFEAFSQEDATRTSSYQGTGLGMSITKQLLQIMGGDISVESELGKGTKFTLTIPLQLATSEQIEEWKKNKVKDVDVAFLNNKCILVCEDHPLNAKIVTRLLTTKGIKVEHATNGENGVKMFAESDVYYYDAILMDIRMPVMDGIDAAKTIRKLEREDAQSIPIIAMTANAFDDDVRQTMEAGMDAHLSKPIQTELLYNTLEMLMKLRG